jgi:hypothetical protein
MFSTKGTDEQALNHPHKSRSKVVQSTLDAMTIEIISYYSSKDVVFQVCLIHHAERELVTLFVLI